MPDWMGLGAEIEGLLRLRTRPIGYRRLERIEELDNVGRVFTVDHPFTFCQVPFYARVIGRTIAVTREDRVSDRCMRLHGLKDPDEESMHSEGATLASRWFGSYEDARRQLNDSPRIPAGDALVVGPLARISFDPEVILIYGNPAQVMFILCGLQKERYERFQFNFIGEGACADGLDQCYITGKPAVSIPCFGERAFGQVADEEILVALPAGEVERAISGLKKLSAAGLRHPIPVLGGRSDVTAVLAKAYPERYNR